MYRSNRFSIGSHKSRIRWLLIENNHSVAVDLNVPNGYRFSLEPKHNTGVLEENGVYNVVAPGTPDVSYLKVHFKQDGDH